VKQSEPPWQGWSVNEHDSFISVPRRLKMKDNHRGMDYMAYNRGDRTITTERLRLRLFTEADAQNVVELCNNYNLYKSTLHLPYPYSIECALSWIANHEQNFELD
jgi:hypothetical protein